MRPLHDRMLAILNVKEYDHWLDPAAQDPTNLALLLVPYRGGDLTAHPVSTLVNSPRNDDARCVEPVATRGPTDS
jgi:putative SOS response-associated peptidase YedK